MSLVLLDGYVLDTIGPFRGNMNDASITPHVLRKCDSLIGWYEDDDVMLVDRGFPGWDLRNLRTTKLAHGNLRTETCARRNLHTETCAQRNLRTETCARTTCSRIIYPRDNNSW